MDFRRVISLLAVWLACPLSAATVAVNISGFSFTSSNITINVGDTVQWNSLGTGHNVAQSSGAASNSYDGTGFYSGPTCCSGPSSYLFTFNSAGDYYYVCEAHAATFNMKGEVHVVAPTPSATPCVTPSPSPSPSATPTASPSASPTSSPSPSASPSPTVSPDFSPTESPTQSPSFSPSPSFSASPSLTDSPTASPSATHSPSPSVTPSASPSATVSATASPTSTVSPSPTLSPVLSPTPSPSVLALSFAGVEDARLVASPITGGTLRLWARLDGQPEEVEVALYGAAFAALARFDLPGGGGDRRFSLPLPSLGPQPVWIVVRVREDGRWRRGPVLRSYVLR